MSDDALRDEVQTLRDQVARLEADRARPVAVQVEGFEGLRQLSHAIETKNLDAFLIDRSIPDRWFWGAFVVFIIACIGLVLIGFLQRNGLLL